MMNLLSIRLGWGSFISLSSSSSPSLSSRFLIDMTRKIDKSKIDPPLSKSTWQITTIRNKETCYHCGIEFQKGDQAVAHGCYHEGFRGDKRNRIVKRKIYCSGCYRDLWLDVPDSEDDE